MPGRLEISAKFGGYGWWDLRLDFQPMTSTGHSFSETIYFSDAFDAIPDLCDFIENLWQDRHALLRVDEEGTNAVLDAIPVDNSQIYIRITMVLVKGLHIHHIRVDKEDFLNDLTKAYFDTFVEKGGWEGSYPEYEDDD